MIEFNDKSYDSAEELFFEIFNDRLKLQIIWLLQKNTMRFKELSNALSPITNKTLSSKLKELEALNLVTRKSYGEVPPRVDYSLSVHGKYLRPVIEEILSWSNKYAKDFATSVENNKNKVLIKPVEEKRYEPVKNRSGESEKADRPAKRWSIFGR